MKPIVKSCIFLLLAYLAPFYLHTYAYDNTDTHPSINRTALDESKVDKVLKNSLGFKNGKEKKFENKNVSQWIALGGFEEDEPKKRCFRHFHDPLKNWAEAGFDPTKNLIDSDFDSFFESMIYWAQAPEPDSPNVLANEYTWQLARQYYQNALLEGSEKNYAMTFRSLGQLMHLISDAAVPAHVRNDPHPFNKPYEDWVENNPGIIKSFGAFSVDKAIFDMAVQDTEAPSPISALWDHDEYIVGSAMPDGSNNTIGLAEYTNANFLTEDTIECYQHPALAETGYDNFSWQNLETVTADDFQIDKRIYFGKKAGDPIDHLVAARYWFVHLHGTNQKVLKHALMLDKECFAEYAEKLLPRAVGYSAALLDYFFRGEMQVSVAVPVIQDESVQAFLLVVKNVTPTEETMSDGNFAISVGYTPYCGNSDGSDDMFARSDDVPSDVLQYGQETALLFSLQEPIPLDLFNSARCMLAFHGKLGKEEGAVVGKYFLPGKIKFVEDWYKGKRGKHPWFHSTDADNYENGFTDNSIIGDIFLSKRNIRFIGDDRRRRNESFLWLIDHGSQYQEADPNSPYGIPITPDTYLQFKIEKMSINHKPPAIPGYKSHYQYLGLVFEFAPAGQPPASYPALQITMDDQQVDLIEYDEAYYIFKEGKNYLVNIFDAFQSRGMTVATPCYLRLIDMNQYLHSLDQPSTVQHEQNMQVRFINIVEAYREQSTP